ncbi:MAG: hypothetical protein AB7V34_08090 [Brachymonas sp.]
MGFLALIDHLFNLALPALWMATTLVALQRLAGWRHPLRLGWGRQWMWLFLTGLAVIVAGWLVLQRDGAMLTYLALVVATGAVQAWLVHRYRSASQDAFRS